MRSIFIALALSFSIDALACPMADAAAYSAAAAAVHDAEGSKATFKVDGMSCGNCSAKVVTALEGIDGVTAAAVDYQTGEALVAYDAEKITPEVLLTTITGVGFAAEPVVKQKG